MLTNTNDFIIGETVNWCCAVPTADQVMAVLAFERVHGYRPVAVASDMFQHECTGCAGHIEGQRLLVAAFGSSEGADAWISYFNDATDPEPSPFYLMPRVFELGKVVEREKHADGRGHRVIRSRKDVYVRQSIDVASRTVHYRLVFEGEPYDVQPRRGAVA